ncbi:hypothetical protein D9615_000611 [Tricholomella constricta]|uniref:Ubiquitin carboxyl-terminal hydrolase n=1 Tax=Tricholomella constricta TaxID=117010 RepID=A0A8H5HQU2_9AGAR|nr:hypothetical protein D9615_000611 [Tricholomella constricta]
MMLASPLLPTQPVFTAAHVSDDSPLQYRPARDKEAFNSLLPPPIEFIEGSSSGALAVPPGKYEPINASPKASKPDRRETSKPPTATPVKPAGASTSNLKSTLSLHPGGIDATWPETCNRATGLYNSGNTCFLNSALQCLLHTPPLLRMLITHKRDTCRVDKGFCMSFIAKHLRKGRQEDSHEFLRYAIDAMQKACLAGHPPKLDPRLAETTWVHKIFGGQLRSRVTCRDCGHNSDTFDRILDLSVDIHRAEALKEALKKFVAVDYLKGADKYKCEKCKKHVNAEKRFTVHEAPLVLTVHLKRFSPLGRKIGHFVQYDDELSLQPYMSEGHYGPTYSLYSVICHAGGGPNSGHYYSFVKSRDGRWWEMNDESVSPISGPPHKKNAYMLFYQRKKGQGLEAAVNPGTSQPRPSLVGSMKKRKEREGGDEDTGIRVSAPFIGPLLPSPALDASGSEPKRQKVNGADPQAALVKKKIQAAATASAKSTLKGLAAYASEDEDEGEGDDQKPEMQKSNGQASSPPTPQPLSSQSSSSLPVPVDTFYSSSNSKKRNAHYHEGLAGRKKDARRHLGIQSRSSGYRGSNLNPYASLGKRNNRPRGI